MAEERDLLSSPIGLHQLRVAVGHAVDGLSVSTREEVVVR